jgi:hypothetical protein
MTSIVVFLAALLVLAVSVLFVLHCEYHAGFVGNIGLGVTAVAAYSTLCAIVDAWRAGTLTVYLTPAEVMVWCGLALFLGRQAVVFLTRWLGQHATWYSVKTVDAEERRAAERSDPVLGS